MTIVVLLQLTFCHCVAYAQKMEAIEAQKAAQVVRDFYGGWQRLSLVSDFAGGEADAIECEINGCAEGGDDCLEKAQIDLPREFEYLQTKDSSMLNSMRLGTYMVQFKDFIQQEKATIECAHPRQIAPVRGITHDLPSYFCFAVDKTYTWNDKRNIRVITDTVWVKSSIRRISGIRNEFGGSGMVHFDAGHLLLEDYSDMDSEANMNLLAASYYDQKKYEDAFRIYRKLAYADFDNRNAQYYLVLMEHRKLGCKWMDDYVRKAEMAWLIEKNAGDIGSSSEMFAFSVNIRLEGVKSDPQKLNMPGTEIDAFSTMARSLKPFSKGLMVAKNKNNQYGFLNEFGKIVIPYQYNMACSFDESGVALVSLNGLMGFINIQGAIVIPCEYKSAQAGFQNGRAFALKEGKTYLIDTKGSVLKVIDKNYQGMLNTVKTKKYAFLQ